MFLYNKSVFLQMGPQPKLTASACTRAWYTCIRINTAIHLWLYSLPGIENSPFCLYLVQ